MMDPRYRDVKRGEIPEVSTEGGAKVRIVCGRVNGLQGPVRDIVTDPEYFDVAVPKGATFTHEVKKGNTVFAYVIQGSAYFDSGRDPYAREEAGRNYFEMERDRLCGPENLVHYGDGDAVSIAAEKEAVRFLLVSGKPIGEPVAWYGPIVMNTPEEIRIAFEEYRNGTFIKRR
jgi:hypothetical protein